MPAFFERRVRDDILFPRFSRRYECDRCSAHSPLPGPCLICCNGHARLMVGTEDEVEVQQGEDQD